jgi:hypothetical protein
VQRAQEPDALSARDAPEQGPLMAGVAADAIRSHTAAMERLYEGLDAPCFIHSFWPHDLTYQSQAVPGVSVTIPVLFPHFTDRWTA